jgi:hypothetical protein
MYDLKKLIEANTVDGVIDYEKVMGGIDQDYVNPIVAKKTDKEKLMPEVIESVVKELGIDGKSIDDLKLYVKKMGGSTDEIKEANIKLELQLKEIQANYDKEVATRTELENKAREDYQVNKIKSLGIDDTDQVEFLKFKFNKQVTDDKDFDSIVAEYAKENGVKTTTKFIKDDFGNPAGTIDLGEVWREKNKIKTK